MFAMADMFEIFQKFRGNSVVIPGRGAKHWRKFSDFPQRDVPLGDPAMGGHSSFAMGLALAQPSERIILFDSEGDILMNLGALVTIAEKAPKNFYHGCFNGKFFHSFAVVDIIIGIRFINFISCFKCWY